MIFIPAASLFMSRGPRFTGAVGGPGILIQSCSWRGEMEQSGDPEMLAKAILRLTQGKLMGRHADGFICLMGYSRASM